MFPRLTALQWLLAAAFLFFFGFAVFAVTRDYYLRHPPRPAVAAPPSAADAAALGQRMRAALGADDDAVLPAASLPDDPALLSREADRLFTASRYPEAIVLYRRVLGLTPGDPETQNDLGLALHYGGDTPAALAVLGPAAEAAPDFQRVWLSLGFIAAQAGDTERARRALTHARDLDPASEIGVEAVRLLDLL